MPRATDERLVSASLLEAAGGFRMKGPLSFQDLFLHGDDPPIERAALVLARDAYPQLDVDAYLARLDAMAAPLAPRLSAARNTNAQAAALGTYVYDELGFHGDEETYYDPRNSYLNEVLDRKVGIPISLAVVLIALGTRAGITVEGVGFPGHFLVRLGGEGGVYLDPFFHARILSRDNLERLARRAAGDAVRLQPEHLAPVSARAMVARMLTNLKAIYESRHEHSRAMVVCDRLVDLTSSPEIRRDRGMHAIALGATAAAVADLQAYLEARPEAADVEQVRQSLDKARTQRTVKAN